MNKLRSRIVLLLLFYATAKAYDAIIPLRPSGEFWDMTYFGFAASVDWFMYRICHRFISGKLLRDIEALCIASIVINALGFALYMAEYPPSIYNWMITGVNYVLAIRLTLMGGGDVFHNTHWRDMVRSVAGGRSYSAKEKEE
jgi:hypothetical protein